MAMHPGAANGRHHLAMPPTGGAHNAQPTRRGSPFYDEWPYQRNTQGDTQAPMGFPWHPWCAHPCLDGLIPLAVFDMGHRGTRTEPATWGLMEA